MIASLTGYLRFGLNRLGVATLTVWGVATLVFFVMRLIPGTYVELFFPLLSPQEQAAMAHTMGLDRPVIFQYLAWCGRLLGGDFGTSLASGRPVIEEIAMRMPLTLELGGLALLVITVVGLPLGILSGVGHRSAWSQLGRHTSTLLMSIPIFVMGGLLVYLFSAHDLGLKAGGWADGPVTLTENLRYAVLPALTLATAGLGMILGTARASVLTALAQDHVLAAVSRGTTPWTIVRRHILRNALIPVVTIYAILAGHLLGGAVLVETVFNLNGVGRLIVNSVASRDYPVVQTTVILTASVFVLANTVADLLYGWIDPRSAEKPHE